MYLFIKGHRFAYELENVLRTFVPDVVTVEGAPPICNVNDDFAYLRIVKTQTRCTLLCAVQHRANRLIRRCNVSGDNSDHKIERTMACMLYDIMASVTYRWPAWGVVTGVRPAKFISGMLNQGMSDADVAWKLCSEYRVDAQKARLVIETARNGMRLTEANHSHAYSLYISIPFCPSRCSYCSFISKTVERDKTLIDRYIEMLCLELEHTTAIARNLGLRAETVYIGGGTPTVLTEAQLKTLTDCIAHTIPIEKTREYTVEAGRPDTITPQKLAILKAAGATRISINPQTANDDVRKAAGRNHTAHDVERAFMQAREAGFDVINMDIIAGLPQDTIRSFENTMDWLFALGPENITVHALTKKRASNLHTFGGNPSRDAAAMVDYATEVLLRRGYIPYYMYKQKGTVDALENTGYAKPGTACLYNVYMMEELHTVLACGAGSVTKLVNQQTAVIDRIFNYKYPLEYTNGFDTLISRKERIGVFYESSI